MHTHLTQSEQVSKQVNIYNLPVRKSQGSSDFRASKMSIRMGAFLPTSPAGRVTLTKSLHPWTLLLCAKECCIFKPLYKKLPTLYKSLQAQTKTQVTLKTKISLRSM